MNHLKANLFDLLPVIITTTGVFVILFVGLLFTSNIRTAFSGAPGVPTVASSLSDTIDTQASWTFDFVFVMLLFCLPLASAILAYFVNIPPFFFFATLGIFMIIVIIANSIGDVYTSFATGSSTMLSIAARLPMTNYIMSHFVIYSTISCAVIAFGVFMKPRRD